MPLDVPSNPTSTSCCYPGEISLSLQTTSPLQGSCRLSKQHSPVKDFLSWIFCYRCTTFRVTLPKELEFYRCRSSQYSKGSAEMLQGNILSCQCTKATIRCLSLLFSYRCRKYLCFWSIDVRSKSWLLRYRDGLPSHRQESLSDY